MALKLALAPSFAYGLLSTSAFLDPSIVLKSEFFLQSAQPAAISWKITARNDNGAENGTAPSFALWFVVHFGFFMAPSFVFKREFSPKRYNRRLFCGNGGSK